MKALIINGSPRKEGNSETLIKEIGKVFDDFDVETERMEIGAKEIRGCISCNFCKSNHRCVFSDPVNIAAGKLRQSDGLIVVSPVYYASPNGTVISFLDRLFYSLDYDLSMKIGAAFSIARRAGTVSSFDVLNKYFLKSAMPVVAGDYWNNGFGGAKGEIKEDEEGLRNARVVAKRMVFLMTSIAEGKKNHPDLLEEESPVWTNFIR